MLTYVRNGGLSNVNRMYAKQVVMDSITANRWRSDQASLIMAALLLDDVVGESCVSAMLLYLHQVSTRRSSSGGGLTTILMIGMIKAM